MMAEFVVTAFGMRYHRPTCSSVLGKRTMPYVVGMLCVPYGSPPDTAPVLIEPCATCVLYITIIPTVVEHHATGRARPLREDEEA